MARPQRPHPPTPERQKQPPLGQVAGPRVRAGARRRGHGRLILLILLIWAVVLGAMAWSRWIETLPDAAHLLAHGPSHEVTILDSSGRMIARRGLRHGRIVPVEALPSYVPDAFIAIEDRSFRYNIGIDPVGIVRAAFEDLVHGHVVQGGSTLTQQLAKNLFLTPRRTFDRKIQEALLALYLDAHYSKNQILTLYLNRVYFGAGAYGIEAAAERFFGKPAAKLSLTEAAMLAGSVRAPAYYNALNNADASMARAKVVLAAMVDCGFITAAQAKQAGASPPRIVRNAATPDSGYFTDWIMSEIPHFVPDVHEPIIVRTTFNLGLEADAEQAVDEILAKYGPKYRAHQSALVALRPDGAIVAMVGGRSYVHSPYNRATDALRQPGSAFKAFLYVTAFEQGHTPDEIMVDGPVDINGWKPSDYERRYAGPMPLIDAFAQSSNVIAAKLMMAVGPAAVVRTAHLLGIRAKLDPVPSLALGTSPVSALELTGAYAAIANGGMKAVPYAITAITTRRGRVLYLRHQPQPMRVIPQTAEMEMTQVMQQTVRSGTGRAAALGVRPTAGKTGTTQDYHDAWFVGFTSDYVCGVWVGNDNNAPMRRVVGGMLPAWIFHAFMGAAEQDQPPRPLAGAALIATLPAQSLVPPPQPQMTAPQQGSAPTSPLLSVESIIDRILGRGP
ncbi:MAG: PBP1A family penicillin-binding protein [Alphaproteobacteria bacterium]|nr:PBP1A family penicillin-binding protein [Alphaproteobacteria bacterium]